MMLARPAGQLRSTSWVTPHLHRLPSLCAALAVLSLSEKLVRTALASPPLLCAVGSNLFPVRTNTSAIHGRILQVRRAAKPRGSQKEAGSAVLRHSDHCFSVRGALGPHRCPRGILLGAFASHRQSPVASTRTCPALWRPGLGLRDDSDDHGPSGFSRSALRNSSPLRTVLTISLFDFFCLILFFSGMNFGRRMSR